MTTPKDDGRAAFPRVIEHDHCWGDEPGMTLRQWYAGIALPAAIQEAHDLNIHPDKVALEAVEYADALIAELDRSR